MYATLAPAELRQPDAPRQRPPRVRSAADLRKAMEQARSGALRVDTSGLDRVLRLDEERQLLEVQAATPWTALAAHLGASAPELAVLSGHCGLAPTIQESLAENEPGPDGRPICAHLESLALVTADAELRHASRSSNRELFALAIGGRGLFGLPYSVTLRLASLRQACAAPLAEASLDCGEPDDRATCELTLLVPPARLDELRAAVLEHSAAWRLPIAGAVARRTLPEDETFLRWAHREYAQLRLRLARPTRLGDRVRTAQAKRALIDAAIELGGAFSLSSIVDASRAQAEACYPRLKAFLAEKRRLDPADRLHNGWYLQARGLLAREPVQVRWG
jgi:FAD/FMN-containing dehydrogenase